ncbi:MAG: DUF5723 family protein [Candidatus Azobacteroides sp.]|nr:DUF5723 family protein [Candidatus Azobacteroides sp.]
MKSYITPIYIVVCLFFYISITQAQSVSSDYFIKTSPTRSSLNPAFRPLQGYIGIPFLTNIQADVKTNTINLKHLTFFNDGELVSFLHPSVNARSFLADMASNNYISANVNYKIFSLGFYKENTFWTVDLGIRAHSDLRVPKDLFSFLKEGFTHEEDKLPSKLYDLKNTNATLSAFYEAGVGYSKSFPDKHLSVGAKAKALVGIGNFDLNVKQLNIQAFDEEWIIKGKSTFTGTLPGLKANYDMNDEGEEVFDDFDIDGGLGVAGIGLGFDLGAVYDFKGIAENMSNNNMAEILRKTKISLAFTDIGFVSWFGNHTVKQTSSDIDKVVSAKDYNDDTPLGDRLDDIIDDFENILDFKRDNESNKGYSTRLFTTMNLGLEYEVWENNMTAGLLSSTQFGKYHTNTEFTLSANYHNPQREWLAATLSYSFIHSYFNTFGLAIHLAPRKGINFFLASDYIIFHVNNQFIPTSSKAVNFQIGFSIPMGERKS